MRSPPDRERSGLEPWLGTLCGGDKLQPDGALGSYVDFTITKN